MRGIVGLKFYRVGDVSVGKGDSGAKQGMALRCWRVRVDARIFTFLRLIGLPRQQEAIP